MPLPNFVAMPGIYVHFPFCRQACHYCDFHFSVSLQKKTDYLEALIREINLQKGYFSISAPGKGIISTLYFGGGTPSLFSSDEIKIVVDELKKKFKVSDEAEITLEANPDDITADKLRSWKSAGINRLSIGVQSFADEDLKFMNRAHDAAMALRSVKEAQDAGFGNITLDLIYGTPTLSNDQWIQNMRIAFDTGVNHLSCYALTVESKTALAQFIKTGKVAPPDETTAAEQFELLMDYSAENGFEQYEISNFAKNKKYSLHNSSYWKNDQYLGLGPSAHSYNGKSRQWNVSNNALYIESIKKNKIPFEIEMLTTTQQYNEYILTSLRTKWGCDLSIMKERFGENFSIHFLQAVKAFIAKGWIAANESVYALTREGKFFADKIAAELFL